MNEEILGEIVLKNVTFFCGGIFGDIGNGFQSKLNELELLEMWMETIWMCFSQCLGGNE